MPHRLAVGTEQCPADRYLIARLAGPARQEQGTENNHGYPHSRVRHRDLNLVASGKGKVRAVVEPGVSSQSEALFHFELELFIYTGQLPEQLQLLRLVPGRFSVVPPIDWVVQLRAPPFRLNQCHRNQAMALIRVDPMPDSAKSLLHRAIDVFHDVGRK